MSRSNPFESWEGTLLVWVKVGSVWHIADLLSNDGGRDKDYGAQLACGLGGSFYAVYWTTGFHGRTQLAWRQCNACREMARKRHALRASRPS